MAGKKRGMSLEDKRATILDIFHESKDVFQLKDIEKQASKRGVVLQSVKDVLQSLVDDDLVHQEKIGISNYFWSFPSEAAVKLDNEINKLKANLDARSGEQQRLVQQIAASTVGKEDSVRGFYSYICICRCQHFQRKRISLYCLIHPPGPPPRLLNQHTGRSTKTGASDLSIRIRNWVFST